MAAPLDANDIVSLARIKSELRLDADDDTQDAMLTAHIRAGIAFVSACIDRPLLPTSDVVIAWSGMRNSQRPITFGKSFVVSVESIDYWTLDASLREESDMAIAGDALGRFEPSRVNAYNPSGARNYLHPPAAGWPDSLDGSCYQVNVMRQWYSVNAADNISQAVILCVRQFYDGMREIRPTAAFYALLEPHRYMGV